jgi:hypothetical protein
LVDGYAAALHRLVRAAVAAQSATASDEEGTPTADA